MKSKTRYLIFLLFLLGSFMLHANPIIVEDSCFGFVRADSLTRKIITIVVIASLFFEYLIFRYYMKKEAKIGIKCALDFWIINAITWPITFYLGFKIGMWAEILPIVVEGGYYRWRFSREAKPYAISVIANIGSYVTGLWLFAIISMFR